MAHIEHHTLTTLTNYENYIVTAKYKNEKVYLVQSKTCDYSWSFDINYATEFDSLDKIPKLSAEKCEKLTDITVVSDVRITKRTPYVFKS